MGLIMLDAEGNFDAEASLRANQAHLKMMEIGLAERRGEPVDGAAAAAAMAEVFGGLAGNLRAVEGAVREAQSDPIGNHDGGYGAIVALLRSQP